MMQILIQFLKFVDPVIEAEESNQLKVKIEFLEEVDRISTLLRLNAKDLLKEEVKEEVKEEIEEGEVEEGEMDRI
jgi:hypothetical protein